MIAEEWFGHGTIRCGISYEQGVKAEQERIIKLLEDKNRQTDYRGNGSTFSMREIIALIKGEK